jgi:hypothetical protein
LDSMKHEIRYVAIKKKMQALLALIKK